ncbi:hypothetical protein [Saccharopolyspora hattusasensis]|uniref:hypothetical protein n=1 Tax=Saccharopolyspora hattusasensis TaxID=1128679 RepID=UPI003D95620B
MSRRRAAWTRLFLLVRPWGRTRDRAVAGPQGTVTVRLDRDRCRSCRATLVLLPANLVAGRSYPLGVIGEALVAAGAGAGSGSVATRLGVPAGTVRSWLRRARGNAEQLYRFGVQTVVALAVRGALKLSDDRQLVLQAEHPPRRRCGRIRLLSRLAGPVR